MLTHDKASKMARALEDNERVYFNKEDRLLAVWCGGATVNIYDPDTWDEVRMFTVSEAFRDDSTVSDIEAAVEVRLASDGFVRDGRGDAGRTPRTKVTER